MHRRSGVRFLAGLIALAAAYLPSGARAAEVGPVIYTTPVVYASQGQSIGITAEAVCDQTVEGCTAVVFFRTTPAGNPAELYTMSNPGTGWSSLTMNRDPGIFAGVSTVYSFAVQLPGWAANTRGVDYVIRVTDHGESSFSPGSPGVAGAGLTTGARTSAYHVFVTTPSSIVHAPVLQAAYNQPIAIEARATCAYDCQAVLFYRRTGLLTPSATSEGDPGYNPSDAPDVQWQSLTLSATKSQSSYTQQYGVTPFEFTGSIPANFVDTRGVDYAIRVLDGSTRAWSPGSVYNGYFQPTDGIRAAWWHVHVLNPVIANHEQITYTAAPGTALTLNVDGLCWTEDWRCTANVSYNSFGGPLLTSAMHPVLQRQISGVKIVTFSVTIPASQVVAPIFAYRFDVSDGFTHAFMPGTPYAGYYLKADGIPAGEFTVAVV